MSLNTQKYNLQQRFKFQPFGIDHVRLNDSRGITREHSRQLYALLMKDKKKNETEGDDEEDSYEKNQKMWKELSQVVFEGHEGKVNFCEIFFLFVYKLFSS